MLKTLSDHAVVIGVAVASVLPCAMQTPITHLGTASSCETRPAVSWARGMRTGLDILR